MSDQIMFTSVKVAIHRESASPIDGDGNIYLQLDDEGGGAFFLLFQPDSSGSIRVDPEDIEAIARAARFLMRGVENKGEKGCNAT